MPSAVVVHRAKKEEKTIHFANLMDLSHLKNAERANNSKTLRGVWCSRATTSRTKVDTGRGSQSKVLQRH